MPHRLKGHPADKLWLWTGIVVAIAAVAALVRTRIGPGYHLGDLAALALMVGSALVILISQRDARQAAEGEPQG